MENREPERSRHLDLRFVSAVVVVILLGSVVYSVYRPQASTTTTSVGSATGILSSTSANSSTMTSESSTISPAPCAMSYRVPANNQTTFSNGTQVTKSAEPALLMGTGSTMELCMEYTNFDSNQSASASGPIFAFQWPACYDSCAGPPANGVSTSASPENISVSGGQSDVVEYTIAAGKNSTGFVGLSLGLFTAFNCKSIPLAIGYSPSQVNDSDFPLYYAGLPNCPTPALRAQIIGYTGASIVYLRSESRFNPTESTTNLTVSSFPTSNGGENITFRMRVQSFSEPLNLGNSVGGYVRTFTGNPELTLTPGEPDNYCGWYVNNDTAFGGMTYISFSDMPSDYLQVDEPALELGVYSSANYAFSILIHGPIAQYTAIDVASDVAVTQFFPVSIAGQLQTESGPCPSILQ